jgi:hypothetical protein
LKCLSKYIKQCIENCNVLPIHCPDLKCQADGILSSDEIKFILLSPKLSGSNEKIDSTIDESDHVAQSETQHTLASSLYKKYLNICENIGNLEFSIFNFKITLLLKVLFSILKKYYAIRINFIAQCRIVKMFALLHPAIM